MTTALLIVDMQNVFTSMTTTCLPNILRLSTHFKSHSLPRIFTQHGHTQAELTPPLKTQLVRKCGPTGSIAKGTKDWEFMPDIAPLSTENGKEHPIIHKNTYDAFINTNLGAVLQEKGIERVVVCGVMTDCCCDTTGGVRLTGGMRRGLLRMLAGRRVRSSMRPG
ncbi:MAG: hypothetical protein Q9226_007421 [Calogaya cf. arnoldii]